MKILISFNNESIDCKLAVSMLHDYYIEDEVILTTTVAYHDRYFISCDKLYVVGHYIDPQAKRYFESHLREEFYYFGNSLSYILRSDSLGRVQEHHSASVRAVWEHLYPGEELPIMLDDIDKVVSMRFLPFDSRECLDTYYGLLARYHSGVKGTLQDIYTKKYRDGKILEAGSYITSYLKATTPGFMRGILRGHSAKYYNSHSYDYFLQEDDGCEVYVGWIMLATGEIHYKIYSPSYYNDMLRICHDLGGIGRGRYGEIKTKTKLWDLYGN